MSEILYKAKRMDNGEVVYGLPSYNCVDGRITEIETRDCGFIEVDPETICRYTGLQDKNGTKIFGGDICRDGDNIVRILWNDKHQWGVEILNTENVLSKGLFFPLWQYDNCKENGYRTPEVIGNIFDNPELLEIEVTGCVSKTKSSMNS